MLQPMALLNTASVTRRSSAAWHFQCASTALSLTSLGVAPRPHWHRPVLPMWHVSPRKKVGAES